MSESSEVMSLTCQPGVSRSVLEDIETSVAGQDISVKMVGCSSKTFSSSSNETEMSRHCTPVKTVSLLTSFLNFFSSFSYTYTKGQTLKELDLVGCDEMENSEDYKRMKTMTDVDAITLFSLSCDRSHRILKRYIYFGKYPSARRKLNSTKQHKVEGRVENGYILNKVRPRNYVILFPLLVVL